jgi:hypothetical protein
MFRIASFSQIRQALPSIPLLLDIKEDGVAMKSALASLVRSVDAHDFARIFIKTRSQALADYLRRLPQSPQVALTLCERVALVVFPGVGRFAPGLLNLPRWLVSPNLLRHAVRNGHPVVVSTVNTPKRLHQVLALPGLFGIVTDRPDLLHQLQRRLLSKRNHPDLRPVVRSVSLEYSKPGRNDTRTPVIVDHSTINRWVIKYSPQLEAEFHRHKRPVWVSWRLDETYLKVEGQGVYLCIEWSIGRANRSIFC